MPVYAISPELDSGGRLAHLASILDDDKKQGAIPLPRPGPVVGPDGTVVWAVDYKDRQDSAEVYAKLGVGAVFAGHATIRHQMVVCEAQVGLWAYATDPNAFLISVFYGVGFRVALSFLGFEGGMNLSAGIVAANVEAKGLQVSYEIESIGLDRGEMAAVLAAFPALEKFDVGAYVKLQQLRKGLVDSLKEKMKDPSSVTRLQPTIIEVSDLPISDTMKDATERRYVMQSIADKLKLEDMLAGIGKNGYFAGVRPERARKIYADFTLNVSPPSPLVAAAAAEWLKC